MKTGKNIRQVSIADTVKNSQLALPLIAAFEIFMIVSWSINVEDKGTPAMKGYLVCYIVLLLATIFTYFFVYFTKKNIDKHWRKIDIIQHSYCILVLLWALSFTYIAGEMHGHFDYLVYVTIITVVPLFTFLHPLMWIGLQVCSFAFMLWLASHHDHFFAFSINFSVFSIISMAAGWALYRIRRSAYLRQIELERERNRAHVLAYTDTLTNLPNRHSCNAVIEELKKHPLPADLIVAVLDVNGLKYANDVYGHDVGDVLIQGAGSCMQKVFGSVGTIYRVGGDEFTGFLHCTEEQFAQLLLQFDLLTRYWSEQQGVSLTVSVGSASVHSNPTDRLATLITKADNAMYDAKKHHYEEHPKA